MTLHQAKPSPALAPYVKQYWCLEAYAPQAEAPIQRVVPNGLMELVFYLADTPTVLNSHHRFDGGLTLCGHTTSFFDLEVPPRLLLFTVSFQPCGVKALLGIPANELLNHSIPLRDILKDGLPQLEESLQEATSFAARVAIAERFLLQRLAPTDPYELARMGHSLGIINHHRGLVAIGTLAAEACLCRKQFERRFLAHVGISPKQFLRILRFQNALLQKARTPGLSLTELAYTCGYYDQSHMVNDFRALAGVTPSQYFAACEPVSDYFSQ